MTRLPAQIAEVVRCCAADPARRTEVWIREYGSPAGPGAHQFLVMLKPELVLPAGGDGARAVARVLDMLAAHGVGIGAVRVLSGAFVAAHAVIESHYPALNRIARLGLAGMSRSAIGRLDDAYPGFRAGGGRVLGAFELLGEIPEMTPYALELLTRNVTVRKFGTGTYAVRADVDGEDLVVLNPFHPQQIAHFTAQGGAVALLECRSDLPLPTIRRDVVGATDPRDAVPGSVKGVLRREATALGLGRVSTRRNGIHVSPGAVEAMATVARYFSAPERPVHPAQTAFGRDLMAAGLSADAVAWAAGDPDVDAGQRSGSLFELTEDLDWADAVAFVTALVPP